MGPPGRGGGGCAPGPGGGEGTSAPPSGGPLAPFPQPHSSPPPGVASAARSSAAGGTPGEHPGEADPPGQRGVEKRFETGAGAAVSGPRGEGVRPHRLFSPAPVWAPINLPDAARAAGCSPRTARNSLTAPWCFTYDASTSAQYRGARWCRPGRSQAVRVLTRREGLVEVGEQVDAAEAQGRVVEDRVRRPGRGRGGSSSAVLIGFTRRVESRRRRAPRPRTRTSSPHPGS